MQAKYTKTLENTNTKHTSAFILSLDFIPVYKIPGNIPPWIPPSLFGSSPCHKCKKWSHRFYILSLIFLGQG